MSVVRPLDQDSWNAWVSTRPEVIQEMCRSHPPDRLYCMASTGHRVTIYSYSEDKTCTVSVTGDYNLVTLERNVFGIPIDQLTECDPPGPNEPVGDLGMSIEDVFPTQEAAS